MSLVTPPQESFIRRSQTVPIPCAPRPLNDKYVYPYTVGIHPILRTYHPFGVCARMCGFCFLLTYHPFGVEEYHRKTQARLTPLMERGVRNRR